MSKIKTAMDLLKQDPKRLFSALSRNNFLNWVPDKLYLKMIYYFETGNKLNLKNPMTYNEKLQWLKLHDRKTEYVTYVDKFAVREYISLIIGEKYLIPLIGVYDKVEDIPWNELPDRFVLKCTHGSHSNIICANKKALDIEKSKEQLNKWMKRNWFWFGREWPYKNVKPRIVCEMFISDTNESPDDYKVLCFNGKAKLIEVHLERFGNNHTQDFYDVMWHKTQISQGGSLSDKSLQKPACFEEMIRLSELLARNMCHVRIDWYIVSNKLYFGEITFYDASGFDLFDNPEDELMLGKWIDLI